MTSKVENLLKQLRSKEYKKLRKPVGEVVFYGSDTLEEHMQDFKKVIALEHPVLFENDDFGFNRGIDLKSPWGVGNVTPNYYRVISQGFDVVSEQIKDNISKTQDEEKKAYGNAMLECINICFEVCDNYKKLAKEKNNIKLYNALSKIPHKGAESFYEACVFLKLCIYFLRYAFIDHLGLGRFDQYMYSFYNQDKARGISDDEILETIEGFFISINYDTDLYAGMQQGDNGQSMVLGGFDKEGNSVYNELSKMCMKASLELSVIDPKINLRVGKNTPDEVYEYGTLLTKQGLGFPQYCNDDVVVPGLVKLGYDIDDATDYTVAACWEYIIPNCGADIPNIDAMDFPSVINRAIKSSLMRVDGFDELMQDVKTEIAKECSDIIRRWESGKKAFRPLMSVFMDGCIESLADMRSGGCKYMNFGCHGSGIANAADALAAVKQNIFDKEIMTKEQLLDALSNNFEGYEEVRNLLRNSPKMGNNDDYIDSIACELMKAFSENMNNKDNGRGGIWRAGTGSAHMYIILSKDCPATADGRKSGEPYSSSFSPSLDIKTSGLLSVIQSFTKYDMTDIINGGPLTIEIHDTVLRNDVGIKKTAMLVKNFILLGGHQLQLNSINREQLLDAQKHPENYPNLIVRVWGWSGYFNELDLEFQNHIIRRCEYIN